VKSIENQKKQNEMLSSETIRKMSPFWELLAKSGQISPAKLANLKRDKITDGDKEGFIKRQLVETRQITKHVANILTEHFRDTNVEVLTPRAALAHQFAKELGLVQKNRDINDYHHAHDAYLNAMVATYVYKAYPSLRDIWVYGNYIKNKEKKLADKELKNLVRAMKEEPWIDRENGEVLADKDATIAKMRTVLGYRNINIVKKTERLEAEFSKDTIMPAPNPKEEKEKVAEKVRKMLPVKQELDPALYGGRIEPVSAYAVVVRTMSGKIKALSIPVTKAKEYEKDSDKLAFLQKMYTSAYPVEIIIEKMEKFTKYRLPNGDLRYLSTYKEASFGSQMGMYKPPTQNSSKEELMATYETLCDFICENNLYGKKQQINLRSEETRARFENLGIPEKLKVIKNLMQITKGTNRGLAAMASIGIATDANRFREENKAEQTGFTFEKGTTLIYQSITGLYETRVEV
jgi:CRISPR-associated endonuclease Csn1